MSKICTKNRKEFRVGDFFDAKRGKSLQLQKINEGDIPVIAAAGYNQGIAGYYDVIAEYENRITVSCNGVGCGSTFYHDYPFAINGDAIVLLEKINISDYSKKYIVSVLNTLLTNKYSYEEKCSGDKAKQEIIILPTDKFGNPDREYMEIYMKNLEEKCKTKLQNLILARGGGVVRLINTNLWKEFKVGDLFEISGPNPRSQNNYEDGEVPFVASGDVNNGILKYCKPRSGENLDIGNCITVSPVDGSSFYQENDFLGRGGAGSSIMILRNKNLHKYCGLFVAGIIRKCCNFTYNDMGNREKLKNLIVKFPVDSEGNPNRDFMENYIKNIIEKNREKLKCLN